MKSKFTLNKGIKQIFIKFKKNSKTPVNSAKVSQIDP